MGTILQLRSVSKTYREGRNEVPAVESVSLDLRRGELLLLMGPSGSGKTTLLSMMGCILRPTAGEIRIDGTVVDHLQEATLPDIRKKHFGFVFQSFNLFPSLTAAENIELLLRMKGHEKKTLRAEALRLLEKVGLSDRTDFYPADLSGGQKQRIAFARALVGDPPIILADEPTANLDSKRGREVLELLKRHAAEQNKAVAVVSHDPKAEAAADRVIFLEDGRIKE
ncbi:MAG: ABC transporter ATP-binding protein [Nitrospirae bacterium]|nr:ABC transporter ATP-binding protein [Nitrospirota bacterium]